MTCNKSAMFFVYVLAILLASSSYASAHSSNIDDNERTVEHHKVEYKIQIESTLRAADCPCENGKCVTERGAQVCKCNPEFGLYKTGICKACDCGKNMNCTFDPRFLQGDGKKCICPTGYVETAGKCRGGCRLNPCRKGTCEDGPGKQFKCICPKGFFGEKCEIKDLCSSSPCKNGGICSMNGANMNCTCLVPFSGTNCEKTPCSRNLCKNGGTCSVTKTGFNCTCRKMYTGVDCGLAPCNRNPCKNGGTCQISPTGYYCSCRDGFKGINCTSDPCTSNPCKNGGTCNIKGKDFSCSCKVPYSGKTCEASPCYSNPCKNNGTCNVAGTSFNCSCKAPYSGAQCESGPCSSNPCKNNGTCKVEGTSSSCSCKAPYSGAQCEIGPCSKKPCLNNGNCTVSGLSYTCSCPIPFSGNKCEIKDCHCENGYCVEENGDLKCVCNPEFGPYDEHKCKACKCGKGANCTFDIGTFYDDVICICPKGYEVKGEKCVAIDPCLINPCKNKGVCVSHEIEYKCNCQAGYSGDNCENDPCSSKPCMNGGTCSVTGSTFKCSCKTPFFGNRCENDTCTTKPCRNNGTCTALSKESFKCDCKEPFSGKTCEDDPCTKKPCHNEGKCIVSGNTFKCDCKKPYFGDVCTNDPCTQTPCKNGGTCRISEESFKCECKKPFYGDECEKKECLCENGKCIETKDGLKCVCNPEYGPYKEGVCKECKCGKGANCTFDVGTFFDDVICICPKGYEVKGEKCVAIDPCLSKPCKNGGTCVSHEIEYKCNCQAGYSGDNCENDPCSSKPCLNGGTCSVTGSTFKCSCKTLFFGNRCENDTCTTKPCKNNGTCTALSKESFKCDCNVPFSGKTCEDDPCTKKPCHNEGKCTVSGNTFKCDCKKPYFGDVCSNDPCTQTPCKNGGTCRISEESFKCECKKPFSGDECDKKECLCENGKCIETKDGLQCVCNPEYGLYEEGVCKACNCGPGANCTFKGGSFFDDIIHCICPAGYKVQGEKCIPDYNTSTKTSNSWPTTDTATESPEASSTTPNTRFSVIDTTLPATTTVAMKSTIVATTDTSKVTQRISTVTGTETIGSHGTLTTNETSLKITTQTLSSTTLVTINFTDANLTTTPYEYSTFTFGNQTTTPITVDNTTDSMNSTSPSLVNVTDTEETSSTAINRCEPNPCYNGGTCSIINEMIYCFCRYPYGGRFCRESEWCMDSWGATFCPNNCDFNFTTNIGRCLCEKGQVYNYNLKKCEPVDMCPFMPGQCAGKNEICLYSKCECEENYKRNDKNECVPNFCDSKLNPCGQNAKCEDLVDQPKHMKCMCKDGYTFIGKSCQKVNKCSVPGLARCQQVCNTSAEACECLPGYKLLRDEKSCELINQNETCTKDCGIGVCKNTEDGEECMCPLTHIWNGTTCVDLCTANKGTLGLCPDRNCTSDEELGFKCVCSDPFTYSSDNVTCRRKSMCVEGNGIHLCAEKGAVCLDDFDKAEGYTCECPIEQAWDTDGKCKNKCDLKENQDHCANKQGTCSTEGSKIKCVCPPLVTHDIEGNCNKLAEFSYFVSFPLARGKYISQQSSVRTFNAENNETVDYVAVNKDVSDTLKFLFGQNYDTAKLFKCSDSPTQNILTCEIEVQFHNDPKDQKKIIPDKDSCISKEGTDTCILPPRLMLHKPLIRADMLTKANPCAPGIKKIHCGSASECIKTDNISQNFICTCSSGFRSNGLYYPFVDGRTIIHRCEDIDECKLPRACPNRTRCLNTYGSYECQCQEGYQSANVLKDPKIVGCTAICSSKNCVHGNCDVVGKQFYCKCDDGYVGKNCDQTFLSSAPETGSMRIALIVLSTMTIPLILFSIYMFVKYKTFKKSTSESSYFDDRSALTMNMVPMAQRERDSDVPS